MGEGEHKPCGAEKLDQTLRQASADSMLDPQVLLEAVRDPVGRMVDLVYRNANRAACSFMGLAESELVGCRLLETLPNLMTPELAERYSQCLRDGQPVVIDDFGYSSEILDESRRYDLRATRAAPQLLSLTWRDVTERFRTMQRLAASERSYRVLAENAADVVFSFDREGRITWISPSVEQVLDAPSEYWIGLDVRDMLAPQDRPVSNPGLAGVMAGGVVRDRLRVVGANGSAHWVDVLAKPMCSADGRVVAGQASLRLADDDVAAALELETAYGLLRANADCMLDPQVLIEAVRDQTGRVVDFIYRTANHAACSILKRKESEVVGSCLLPGLPGIDTPSLIERWAQCLQDGQPIILDEFEVFSEPLDAMRLFEIRVVRAGADLLTVTWSDVTERCEATKRIADSERRYRLLAENAANVVCHVRDGLIVWVSPSVADVTGGPAEDWIGRSVLDFVRAEDLSGITARLSEAGRAGISDRIQVVSADGVAHWLALDARPYLDEDGREDGVEAALRPIDHVVAVEQQTEAALRLLQDASDAMFDPQLVLEAVRDPDGRVADFVFRSVNRAASSYLVRSAHELIGSSASAMFPSFEFTELPRVFVQCLEDGEPVIHDEIAQYSDVHSGRRHYDYRVTRAGSERLIVTWRDVTERVESAKRLAKSEQSYRLLAERLQSEIGSAAKYVQAVLPGDMEGPVSVSARYLPSNTLGGDCFDFRWIDDDHLMFYLLDVSGHGVESALVAVSVHNTLRSTASLPTEILLEPDQVLAFLNGQFAMELHDSNYFTIFYGVYQRSSATLTYAGGGHPPALLFTGGQCIVLDSRSIPVGVLDDALFTPTTIPVPPGSQIVVCSDGAYDMRRSDGGWVLHKEFVDICTRFARSDDWSLDDLLDNLRRCSSTGSFTDDCCLIRLQFEPSHRASEAECAILETSSGPETLQKIRETLARIWQAHSEVPTGTQIEIGIASGEIGANIVDHAAVFRPAHIRMECLVLTDEVQVRFTDDGEELRVDLDSVRLPDELAGRGRGLAVARAVLRNLSYERTGGVNRWTLVSERFSC